MKTQNPTSFSEKWGSISSHMLSLCLGLQDLFRNRMFFFADSTQLVKDIAKDDTMWQTSLAKNILVCAKIYRGVL